MPLASTDDVDVAAVLIDHGCRLGASGGSIGTPLDNAIGCGWWHVARLLAQRGAPVTPLWQAAALGMLTRLDELLAAGSPADGRRAQRSLLAGLSRRPAVGGRTAPRCRRRPPRRA
jgi:hypothetical protein